jgi:SET domain-containing protein
MLAFNFTAPDNARFFPLSPPDPSKPMATQKTRTAVPKPTTPATGPRFVVRSSGIHGRGVFARRVLREDETVIEYKGEIISEAEIERRYPEDLKGLNHTFIFGVEHDYNIDGGAEGNAARWINHSCAPNCDTFEENRRIFIRAARNIRPGEELTYDYAIEAGEPLTKALKARWPCWCGAKKCRGTVLVATPKPKKRKKSR